MIFTCTEYSPRSRIFSKDFPLFIPYSSLRVYSLPRASLTRFHKLGGLNNRIHWLTVLEARSMKPRCWQGSSFWGLRETTCCMFLSQLLVLSGILQLVATSPQPLPSSSLGVLPVCVSSCAQISPFYRHQSHWIKVHPDHLMLTCSSANTPFPNEMSCTGPESYDFNISDMGNTSQPIAGRYFISILQMRKLRHRERSNLPEASG